MININNLYHIRKLLRNESKENIKLQSSNDDLEKYKFRILSELQIRLDNLINSIEKPEEWRRINKLK